MISLALLSSLTLVWNANEETDIATYKIYYGVASGRYISGFEVGNVTQFQPSSSILQPGQQVFFVVTAVNTSGLESDYSNEVSYTRPAQVSQPRLDISVSDSAVTLSWLARSDEEYTVWAKEGDDAPWERRSIIGGSDGPVYWTDVADRPKRIYRLEIKPK